LVSAPDPRYGKTYLINLIGVIATGHIPVSTAGAEKKEEFEKRIETAALAGRSIIHLNNLPNGMVISSERLAELCTEGKVTIRKLGRHEEGECDCHATTTFLNGNNVLMAEDLGPRTVHCRLDAGIENPEERTFDFDPIEVVQANRGAYLADAFAMVRAFDLAGRPKPDKMKRVAGFDVWSGLIQQLLIWLGMEDPLAEMEALRAIDPAEENLRKLLAVLAMAFSTENERKAIAVSECVRKADHFPDLKALMTFDGEINTRSFGRLLSRSRNKVRNGWFLTVNAGKENANTYTLNRKAGAPPADDETL